MPDPNDTRESLIEKRRELEARVEAAQRDLWEEPGPDTEAAAEPPPGGAEVNELLRDALFELEEIERKLRRLDKK